MADPSVSSPWSLFGVFLRLGCVCFGGPVAHLGFFRTEFVEKRRWLSDAEYADLVALCQFLPGPASSQVGYAIGLRRGGFIGGLAAWLGFTLPSAALMIGFALGLASVGSVADAGWVVGLKLVAVAVVAHALWGMAIKLCPDWQRVLVGAVGCGVLLVSAGPGWQVVVILAGALVGRFWFSAAVPDASANAGQASPRTGWPWLGLFFGGLVGLPLLALNTDGPLAVVDGFYRAGSLVFGGGHVVLPLLDAFTVGQGWIAPETFLAGYGAAQALPGPLFAFSGFLGASISAGPGGVWGGVLAIIAIYVPANLLILGALPYWERLRSLPAAQAALKGANAAVVGLLAAALIHPIGSQALTDVGRIAFALTAFAILKFTKLPPWALVGVGAVVGAWVF
jgi:chromate transporter